MKHWASSWAIVVITSPATEGTEVALPLMKLTQVLTQVAAAFQCISIIHKPLVREVNPCGVFNRGTGRINWCSSLLILRVQSLSMLTGCLPRCFAHKGERRPQRSPSKPNICHKPFNTHDLECFLLCLPAAVKNNQVFVIQTLFPVGLVVLR